MKKKKKTKRLQTSLDLTKNFSIVKNNSNGMEISY